MIRQLNLTPFVLGYRASARKPPAREMTCIVRAKLRLRPGEPLLPAKAKLTSLDLGRDVVPQKARETIEEVAQAIGQGSLTAEVFEDDDHERSGQALYPSDLAELKLNAEVMLRGTCHPRRGVPECDVTFEVGSWHKTLRVIGPRKWVDRIAGGKATDPLPFRRMPLDWSHAYGGPDYPDNPVGRGHPIERTLNEQDVAELSGPLQRALARHDELPNVEDPRHLVTRSGKRPRPAGFGPVSPLWPYRRQKVGREYGAEYERKYAPYYPRDFDWTHLHAAPADQQLPGYLRGDERLRFVNLHPTHPDFTTELPALRIRVFVMREDGSRAEVPMVLDTLLADLDAEELYLTWRGLTPVREDDLGDVTAAMAVTEDLRERPGDAAPYLAQLEKFADDPVGLGDTEVGKLQALQADIESGKLEHDITDMPEDEHLMGRIIDRLGGTLLPAAELGTLKEATRTAGLEAQQNNPEAPREIKKRVIEALEQSQDPGMPPARTDPEARKNGVLAPFIGLALGRTAAAQAEAPPGLDFSDMEDALDERIAAIDEPSVQRDRAKLSLKAIRERPLVEPAPGCDLSYQDLSDRDLTGVDLTGANLEGALLNRAKLGGARLDGANLQSASLSRADLSDASLRGADLRGAILSRTVAPRADLAGAKLGGAMLLRADLGQAKLDEVDGHSCQLSRVCLAGASLRKAVLSFTIFDTCNLQGAAIVEADVSRSLFRECEMNGAVLDRSEVGRAGFIGCDLRGARLGQTRGELANWFKSNLRGADLRYACLPKNVFMQVDATEARFTAADLPEARFYKAILGGADFSTANLRGGDLRKTVLSKASFRRANLYQARMYEAHGVDPDFRGAILLEARFEQSELAGARGLPEGTGR